MELEDEGAFIAFGKRRKLPYQIEEDPWYPLAGIPTEDSWPPICGPIVNGPWHRRGPYTDEWL